MKNILFSIAVLVGSTSALQAVEPAADRAVLLVSVDGLAHFYFDDPKAEMPNIRKLAQQGVRAEKMKAVLPTVTWPNHTTLVTGVTPGKHGVVGNTYLDRKTNEVVPLIWDPLFDKEQIIKVPTIYDVAKAAGLKTAAVTWPASRGATTLDWTVPCMNQSEPFVKYSTPSLLAEFKTAGIPYDDAADGFKPGKGEERDRLYARMLTHIMHTHRPNLMLHHILEVDHIEHQYGPQTPEAYAAVKFADGLVGEIWAELQKAFPDKATIVIVSDHGFFSYRQAVRPNVVLRKAGLLTAFGNKVTKAQVRVVNQGGSAFLYVTDDENREALIQKTDDLFKDQEGVSLVLTPKDFPAYGLADQSTFPQCPDLILSAKKGYTFDTVAIGDEVVTAASEQVKGTHGYDPNEPDLHASFIACGVGIIGGKSLGTISNTSVAPTLAALLGLEMKNVDGKVLQEILQP